MDEDWHGTVGGYTNHGCKCDDCREAKSAANLEYASSRRRELAAWQRRYRRENPERVAETKRRYRQRKKDERS